ncbi:hypothetical protein [Actinopolyspora alba]|uniref:hypothetical protein n=1 Tax=Actinopolyspora alba TaxID=673379 RepID=UPI000A3E3E0A|nr:hypothetical protein [Actinopolyspora alba]
MRFQHGARRGEPGRLRADEGYGHDELRSALLTGQRLGCPAWEASAIRLTGMLEVSSSTRFTRENRWRG